MTIKNLKIIALVTMTLDHIAKFIPNSPIIFRFLGRLSAPLFFFCCAWSIDLTNNKKYYILRLYLFSILMSIINYISMKFIIPNNGYNLNNNIFRTLFLLSIIIYIYDRTLKDRKKRILYIAAFLSWQIINCTIIALLITNHILDSNFVLPILFSVLGLCIDIEGGFFIILGFGCYIYKKGDVKKLD